MNIDEKTEVRYWSRVDRRGPNDCWSFIGRRVKNHRNHAGYGVMSVNGKYTQATHVALALDGRPRPEGPSGEQSRHTCDNPACVNPKHLLWGTRWDNLLDAIERGRRSVSPERLRAIRELAGAE